MAHQMDKLKIQSSDVVGGSMAKNSYATNANSLSIHKP